MYEVNIKKEDVIKAKKMAKEMGVLNKSIEKGEGNVAGFLGEIIIANLFGVELLNDKRKQTDYATYNYDLIINEQRVDVKTKRRSVKPKSYYDCSICAETQIQDCDYYYFVSVLDDYSKAWVLGFYPSKKYLEDARFFRKGEIDPDNNFTFKTDVYNMKISNLYTSELLKVA